MTNPWKAVAACVRARGNRGAARLVGVSDTTIHRIGRGEAPRTMTVRRKFRATLGIDEMSWDRCKWAEKLRF